MAASRQRIRFLIAELIVHPCWKGFCFGECSLSLGHSPDKRQDLTDAHGRRKGDVYGLRRAVLREAIEGRKPKGRINVFGCRERVTRRYIVTRIGACLLVHKVV